MNQAIRSAWIVAIALFALVFGSITYVQFFDAQALNNNDWNNRTLLQDYCSPRGSILVAGQAIAQSTASETDKCKYQRQYLQPEIYAGLTGFFSANYGQYGIEDAEKNELSGRAPDALYDKIMQVLSGSQPQGRSVELTIDPKIQQLAYDMIPDNVPGSIVVMNPKTGAIIAMVSKPSYDTNLLASHDSASVAANYNRLVQIPGIDMFGSSAYRQTYSPGSVFKLVDTAAALASGKYNKDTVLANPQNLPLPGTNTFLPNYINGACHTRTQVNFQFALEQSCNTPFAQIAMDLGQKAITTQAEKFGFNDTNLHFPDKVQTSKFPGGTNPTLSPDQLAISSIGQLNVTATPLEIAMMTAAIANGGVQMKPNLVKAIRTPDLRPVQQLQPEVLRQSTTPEIAKQITEWMTDVVSNGIASGAAIPGVQVAGKTGTAETLPGQNTANNSWFTGFAPANDPQVVVSIVMPGVDIATGGRLTSPNAKKLFEAVLNK
ncbi:MAG TPA: penicillin-binding protein 2 [Micrococcaceae bacterium]